MRCFLAGAITFSAAEVWWALSHPNSSRWVLEPASGMLFCMVIILVGSAVGIAIRPREMGWVNGFWLLAAGVASALVFALFLVGPGNLWPIVIAIDLAIITPALILGAGLGEVVMTGRRP